VQFDFATLGFGLKDGIVAGITPDDEAFIKIAP
jgi:hypothetical protein